MPRRTDMRPSTFLLAALSSFALFGMRGAGVEIARNYTKGEKIAYTTKIVMVDKEETPEGPDESKTTYKGTRTLEVKESDDKGVQIEDVAVMTDLESSDPDDKLTDEDKTPSRYLVTTDKLHTKLEKKDLDAVDPSKMDPDDVAYEVLDELHYAGLDPDFDIFTRMPDAAVEKGATWDVVIPKSIYRYSEDQKLQATFDGTEDRDGKTFNVVKIKGTIKVEPDFDEVAKKLGDKGREWVDSFKAAGTIEIETKVLLDQKSGALETASVRHLMVMKSTGTTQFRYESTYLYELTRKD
ncbi:MAG: hypothetical protein JST35_02145 [Armatimonadetes bacterium]|nr:hypothetical protein [Armatimonadota bacterium]